MPKRGIVMEIDEAIRLVRDEVFRAINKHPNWPCTAIYAAAIVAEESGELIKAACEYEKEGKEFDPVIKEAIQTAATCIRLLMHKDMI